MTVMDCMLARRRRRIVRTAVLIKGRMRKLAMDFMRDPIVTGADALYVGSGIDAAEHDAEDQHGRKPAQHGR